MKPFGLNLNGPPPYVKIKIFGITNENDLDVCVSAGSDSVGFLLGAEKLSEIGEP